jgi:hypothetical protein
MVIRSTRLKCSKHGTWLVLRSREVAGKPVTWWACPLDCPYARPDKWQRKLVKQHGSRKPPAKAKRLSQPQLGLFREGL